MASNVPGASAKSDTSRKPPVIKNPLLSSQVTGLTLDDFAPVAVLPPAAPLPTIAKEPSESTGAAKPAIFSAQPGVVPQLLQDDADSFSEIDLSATSESQTPSRHQPVEYNPLQDLEESDGRSPPVEEEQGANNDPASSGGASYLQQTSALTAQFAAQLPNVASTVFSTFSRVIKGNSPAPPTGHEHHQQEEPLSSVYGSAYDSQQEFQNTPPNLYGAGAPPLIGTSACDPAFPSADQQQPHQQQQPPPPPPTFYNPEQVQTSAGPALPPPAGPGLSNTYRLGGSKKKTYAHIPGLSTSSQPGGGVLPVSTPLVASQNAPALVASGSFVPAPISPAQPTSTGAFPFAADTVGASSFPVEAVDRAERPPSADQKSGKPSLFGYLPTKLFDKLPKPSFGGEKREEEATARVVPPPPASIVDQFATLSVGSGPPPPTQGDFFAAPFGPAAQGPQPTADVQSSSSLLAASTTGEGRALAPPASQPLQASPQPPPTFYTPGQIPTVPSTAPTASAVKSNPYSSFRRVPGVGPYKNPLAPQPAPAVGPIFLPNQLPPTVAQTQQLQAHASELKEPPADPAASIFTPALTAPIQPTPVSIFNPVDVAAGVSSSAILGAPSDESAAPGTTNPSAILLPPAASQPPTLVPTFPASFASAGPPSVSIFNPQAEVQQRNNQATNVDVKPPALGAYPPTSSAGSTFPAAAPTVQEKSKRQFETFVEPQAQYQADSYVAPTAPASTVQPNPPATAVSNPWQAQFNSFNIPSGSSVRQPELNVVPGRLDFPQSESAASTSFTQFLDSHNANTAVGPKPIVDSRSRSSENVLSPPPRPNSNLSEPAAIFPGCVPPADIFRSHTSDTSSKLPAAAADTVSSVFPDLVAGEQQQQHLRPDRNANPLDFFGTAGVATLPTAAKQVEESRGNANFFPPPQEQTVSHKPPTAAHPQPTPAINPTDFFNSNSIAFSHEPPTTTVDSTGSKTGQTNSTSVPLFNFFGRAADPAPVAPGTGGPEKEKPIDKQCDGGKEQPEGIQSTTASDQEAATSAVVPSLSNVSSFSNVNDRFEFGSSEDSEQQQQQQRQQQESIGNALNEPIFSSDNLFAFKSSAYQDGGFYSRNTGPGLDANDGTSSMAAMATTSVGAGEMSTNTGGGTGGSVAETSSTNIAYRPTYNHWFYRREIEGKVMWSPFTMADSMALEDGWVLAGSPAGAMEPDETSPSDQAPVIVHTDGGRYDVSIRERLRTPVYWNGPSNEVRRCSWFYKNVDSRFVPYEEPVADQLEREYKEASTSGEWHRRVKLPNGETVVFHGPSVIVHFLQTQNPDTWGGGSSPVPATTNRPRVVKRGIDEFNIDDDEPERIDHLLFMVHGIGEACDLRFRRVEEVVDEFRSISAQLVQSHYRSSFDRGDVGRVEILPISWHDDLHSAESGVDEKLKSITLDSIPKLRHFTNDTLLDVLFYTSPMFCQSIIDAVGNSLNRLYTLFCQRNPTFQGRVSLAGHSLGSLILFDLLCHQKKIEQRQQPTEPENSENPDGDSVPPLPLNHGPVRHRPLERKCSQQINYEVGPAGTGQPYISYPQLLFEPKMFFALGSPIGMFVTIRGIDALGLNFRLPTCDGFFNIFHPYDPVAYRIEALINPELSSLRPVLIPHHKGRKRMHLELKETMVRVSNDLKQRVSDVFRNTLDTVWALTAMSSRPDPKAIQSEVDKVLDEQLRYETTGTSVSGGSDVDSGETSLPLGRLNQSRRVDYVLQEAPFEFINEYLFALTSHVCYWDSEDTMLFVMKEIYSSFGVQTDHQVPQQSMTIERPIAGTSPAASSCSLNSNFNLFPSQTNNR